MSTHRLRSSPDPLRDSLVEVRRGLLRLHKMLIDVERAAFEREHGEKSNLELLQALIDDPYFAWLRPFSRLIVDFDEALAGREAAPPAQLHGFVRQVQQLVTAGAGPRYEEIREREAEVLLAHVELMSRIETAYEQLART